MNRITMVGIDLAKRGFQIHCVDWDHKMVLQRQLSRSEVLAWFSNKQPCLVGMEACATAHYWAQEIRKRGHDVSLIPAAYVKPYVRRQKNDRTDAAAICEAVSRPSMRFVEVKTKDQRAIQVLHRSRELMIQQLFQTGNGLRAHMAEFGWVFPLGDRGISQAIEKLEQADPDLPKVARQAMLCLSDQIRLLKRKIDVLDKHIQL